jgi:uncharacterized membrane protein YfcA
VTGFLAALVIAAVTSPVGVSGAVFLLPVQFSVLHVPSPAVTPTNLLFNVVATPGALWRYRRRAALVTPLVRRLLAGTVPGVVAGSVLRVYVVPGPRAFRLLAAAVLLPIGVWLCLGTRNTARERPRAAALQRPGVLTTIAVLVGVVGGLYGIGGGSLLGPLLVGGGMSVAVVAPAALTTTFATSIVGAATFVVLSLAHRGNIAPSWSIGIACGAGGLIGGYVGAHFQPRVPEPLLRRLLGVIAMAVALVYVAQVV